MNIYFISPQHIRPEDFSFILQALNIDRIFSLITEDSLNLEIAQTLSKKNITYYSADIQPIEYIKSCTYKICNSIVQRKWNGNEYQYIDKNLYEKSLSSSVFKNLKETNDSNILILAYCKTYIYRGAIEKPFFSFELNYPNVSDDIIYKDITTEISRYCLNILRKKLGHSNYNNRICFFKFDEFILRGYTYIHYQWKQNHLRDKKGNINDNIGIILSRLLHDKFPEIYTITEIDNRRKYDKPYPTKEARQEYHNLVKEAERQYENSSREEDNSPAINSYLEVYGDSLSEREYDNYIREQDDF